jgi:hypothetical protein
VNLNKIGGSGNLLVWIIVAVIALGFGKYGNALGLNLGTTDNYSYDKHSRKHHNDDYYPKSVGIASLVPGRFGGLFGGNIVFVLLVVALLFVCNDKKDEYKKEDYSKEEHIDENFEDENYVDDNYDYVTEEV